MRQNTYNWKNRSIVLHLLIANGIVFLFQWLSHLLNSPVEMIFGLVPQLVFKKLMVWQLATYMFLHADLTHLFFNMLGLFIFGRELEYIWGKKEFLKYYFITGIGAGILSWIMGFDSNIPIIGASGAIMGLIAAFAIHFPNRYLYLYFFFPVKAKYVALGYAVLEIVNSLRFANDGIAHFAHIGGLLIGFCYLKCPWYRLSFPSLSDLIKRYRGNKLRAIHKKREQEIKEMKKEVDVILDKISEEGMGSLTRKERKILEKASVFLKKERK